jgi:hypothetical protein
MIDPKIPDEVVEAACLSRYGKNWHLCTEHYKVIERDMARAAIAAAINAWPGRGMRTIMDADGSYPTVFLPLPAPEETKP